MSGLPDLYGGDSFVSDPIIRGVMDHVVGVFSWVEWRLVWSSGFGASFACDVGVGNLGSFVSVTLSFKLDEGCLRGSVLDGYYSPGVFDLDFGDPEFLDKLLGCLGVVFPGEGVCPNTGGGDLRGEFGRVCGGD